MISAVVLTKNEEKNIKDCLDTLSWCDEIIVIDDNSTDKTREIAKKKGAKVFIRNLDNNFSKQRNFGLQKAKGDWVLFVDADERVSQELAQEIKEAEINPQAKGYLFKRLDNLFGHVLKHGEIGNIRLLRFGKKNSGQWRRRVHEVWEVKGEVKEFNNPLLHYPHQTLRGFVQDIDYYSTLHAKQKYEDGETSDLIKILFYPKLKFLQNYIFRLGFLDGEAGFMLAMFMSFHSFLSWSKLWLLHKNKK